MDNMTNRDKIRFMELFKDYSEMKSDLKDFIMIQKREYNPELSAFSNLVLDLVDFKDRVRPLAKDIALMDVTRKYQKHNVKEIDQEREAFTDVINAIHGQGDIEELEER